MSDLSADFRWAPEPKPWLARALGAWGWHDGTIRHKRFELTLRRSWEIGLGLGCYERAHFRLTFLFFSLYIYIDALTKRMDDGHGSIENPQFGFSMHFQDMKDVHLHWNRAVKVINFPWQKRYLFSEFLGVDGQWHCRDKRRHAWHAADDDTLVDPVEQVLPYHYLLSSGEVQHRVATIVRERHTPVHVWFGDHRAPVSDALRRLEHRLKPPVHGLDIAFDGQVGERAGSWKGGCTGCSWNMRPGENVVEALRRMQATRRFR